MSSSIKDRMSFLTHGFQIRYIKIVFESLGYKRQKTQDLVPMFVLCDSNLSFPLSHTLSQTFIPKCYHFHTELRQWNQSKKFGGTYDLVAIAIPSSRSASGNYHWGDAIPSPSEVNFCNLMSKINISSLIK